MDGQRDRVPVHMFVNVKIKAWKEACQMIIRCNFETESEGTVRVRGMFTFYHAHVVSEKLL